MIGNIIGLLLSWLILWLLERKSLLALGFTPVYKRVLQFILGFLFSGCLCASLQLFEAWLTDSSWNLNSKISFSQIAGYLLWNFNSVVFEELLFRGALLYVAIKRLGAKKGVLLSAICFGIYHWFSFGVLGNIVPMIFVFIITGLMGYAWACAFKKTDSMALPVGLHLGWNFVFNAIFSRGFVTIPIFIWNAVPVIRR
jgi:membrane protease YdiL (CAAX protease family)